MDNYLNFASPEYACAYTRAREQAIGEDVREALYRRMESIAGRKGLYQWGPLLVGKKPFKSVIKDRCLPQLIDLIGLADRLHMHVGVRLEQPGYIANSRALTFDQGPELVWPALIGLMEDCYSCPQPGSPLTEVTMDWQVHLLRVMQNGFPVHWLGLIGYFAASGYELHVFLKESKKASEVPLPKRRKRNLQPSARQLQAALQ